MQMILLYIPIKILLTEQRELGKPRVPGPSKHVNSRDENVLEPMGLEVSARRPVTHMDHRGPFFPLRAISGLSIDRSHRPHHIVILLAQPGKESLTGLTLKVEFS